MREWYGLFQACLVVTPLAVHEEDSKVDHVEVRDRRVEAGRERPGERHQEVTPATREYVRGARQEGALIEHTCSSGDGNDPTSPR